MTTIIPVTKNVPVELDKYYDEDGVVMDSNFKPGTKVTVTEPTELVVVKYDNYAVIETEALHMMAQLLNNSDLANVIKMSVTTKTPLNLIYNNNIPHTNETLQRYLQVKSESKYMQLMKRLMKVGILYQIKGLIHGEVRVCYMLNPFISKKRNTVDKDIINIFSEFKELYCKECKETKPKDSLE